MNKVTQRHVKGKHMNHLHEHNCAKGVRRRLAVSESGAPRVAATVCMPREGRL